MKTTGYKLMGAKEQWDLKLEMLNAEWNDSLFAAEADVTAKTVKDSKDVLGGVPSRDQKTPKDTTTAFAHLSD